MSDINTHGITLDFSANVTLDVDTLYSKIKQSIVEQLDLETYQLVKDYYELILDDIFTKKDQGKASRFTYLFTVPKFITAITQVMYSCKPSELVRRRINKMSYDYLFRKDHDKDQDISNLLMTLSETINADKISKLCSVLNISEDLASVLTLARFSSEKETINVKRVNRVLMSQPLKTITEQRVVDIYLALFDHMLPLFTGVMLDVMPVQTLPKDAAEIYGLITLAILDLMNELPVADIKKGLMLFNEDRNIQYQDCPLRLNLESCSQIDYPRLIGAIDALKQDGIYISNW